MPEPDKKPKKLRRKKEQEPKLQMPEMPSMPEVPAPPEADNVKEISIYEPAQCVVEGCEHKAVGKDSLCKRHGGDPVIQENLMSAEEIPSWILAKSKYNPIKHPINFINYSKLGLSEVEIAAKFEVSVGTMRSWAEKFLEFNQAFEIGRAMYEAWWLEEGKHNLDNRNYNVGLYKFLTGNKLGWSDKMESKSLNVSAGVLLVPGTMEEDVWEQQAQEFIEKRGKNG